MQSTTWKRKKIRTLKHSLSRIMCMCVCVCLYVEWNILCGWWWLDTWLTGSEQEMANSRKHFFSFQKPIFSRQPLPTAHAHTIISARLLIFFPLFFRSFSSFFFAPNFACLLKSYISIYTQKLEHFFHKHTKTLKTERQKCASSIFSSSCCARTSTLSNWKKIHIFSPALAFNAYTCLFMCICVFVSKFFFSPRRLYWTVEQQSGPKKKSYNKASPSSVVLILDGMKTKEWGRNKARETEIKRVQIIIFYVHRTCNSNANRIKCTFDSHNRIASVFKIRVRIFIKRARESSLFVCVLSRAAIGGETNVSYTENEKKKGDSNFNNRRVHIHKLTCTIYIHTSQDSFLESMRSGCHVAFSRRRCMQRAGGVIIVFLLFFALNRSSEPTFLRLLFFRESARVFFTFVNACKIHENLGTAYKHYVQYHYIM